MAARKTTTRKTTRATPSRKVTSSRKSSRPQRSTSLMDNFKLGESYTSLVLGIIVVIVVAILLVSLFKTRTPSSHLDSQQGTTSISTVAEQLDKATPTVAQEGSPTPTVVPTATPLPTATATPVPTMTPVPKVTPTAIPSKAPVNQPGNVTYRIKAGDDLWKIAEEQYHDGYQWVAIAKANNLTNPSVINVGNIIVLPKVTPTPTMASSQPTQPQVSNGAKITGTTYVIMHGDDLWDIAVRAYGDGYKWVDIARANGYSSPNLIHAGNSLKIPR
jgi:nucleoid-associated protein YgaU